MQEKGRVKALLSSTPGKIGITALACLVLGYLLSGDTPPINDPSALLYGLAAFILLMLGVPILVGWRRARELAVAGLVAMILAAPVTGAIYTEQIRGPISSATSPTLSNGSAVLTGAVVSPHTGAPGTTFDFQTTIHPQLLPPGAHAPEYFVVYLSTCEQGATTGNDSACGGGGYGFFELNQSFNTSLTSTTSLHLGKELNLTQPWWWIAAFVYTDASNRSTWLYVGDANYAYLLSGPVVGTPLDTFGAALPGLLIGVLVNVGLVYFGGLVIYMWLKSRERNRNAPAVPPAGPGPSGVGGSPSAASSSRPSIERSCPSCGAVVYPEEKACWKCGTALTFSPAALPSGGPPKAGGS